MYRDYFELHDCDEKSDKEEECSDCEQNEHDYELKLK